MKKRCLLALALAACCMVSQPALAVPYGTETFFYGDYEYALENGQATIVGNSGGQSGLPWDDERIALKRPGAKDAPALLPKAADTDGIWRTVVPDSLNGYPVVAIDCLVEGLWGDVVLPDTVIRIERSAFSGSHRLYAITIPPSVAYIGEAAFEDCPVTLRVTEGSYAAQYAQDNDLAYTYDLSYKVFQSDGWLYTLTDGVATIYGYAKDGETDDQGHDISPYIDLVFPTHLGGCPVAPVTRLPLPFFQAYHNLASITIPASVTQITDYPFTLSYIPRVADAAMFVVAPDNPVYEDIDGVLFDKRSKTLIACPYRRIGHYTIPEGVTAIADGAFSRCWQLTSVSIAPSVTRIGAYAFDACQGLTSLVIPDGVTHIGDRAFNACFELGSVTIPPSVTSIGDEAFDYWPVTLTVTRGSYAEQYAEEVQGGYFEYAGADAQE